MSPHPRSLVEPGAVTELAVRAGLPVTGVVPDYLRHKPDTTVIGLTCQLVGGAVDHSYLTWHASPARAAEVAAKAGAVSRRTGPLGVSAIRLDARTVLHAFPNDLVLRRLRWYATRAKIGASFGHLLAGGGRRGTGSTVEVLSYRPERRLVSRIELRSGPSGDATRPLLLVARYTASARAGLVAAVAAELRGAGIGVPRPVGIGERGRLGIDEFVPGRTLAAVLAGPDGPAAALPVAGVAAAIADLHRVAPPPGLPRRTRVGERDRVRSGLAGLAAWDPTLGRSVAAVLDALDRPPPPPEPTVVLHGDLHRANILLPQPDTDTGPAPGTGPDPALGTGPRPGPVGPVGFIDLERVAAGPRSIDLGSIRADLLTDPDHRLDDLEAALVDTGPGQVPGAVAWHTGIGLVDQALLATRRLVPHHPTITRQLLDLAVAELRSTASVSPGGTR